MALITGAGGDIGRAVATRLASQGAQVVLADLESAAGGLARTAADCEDAGGPTPVVVNFDVTDHDGVAASLAELAGVHGAPTLLFNNAGYQGQFAHTADYDVDDFRRVLEVNVTGVFTVMQAVAQAMMAAGVAGSVVNTASMAGVGGAANMAAYSASKSAVIGLTKAAALDLASHNIRVNAVSPAFIGPGAMWDRQVELQANTPSQYYGDTPETVAAEMVNQVPLRRYGSLDEVASAVLFLLSGESSYITGFNLEVTGGL